MAVGNERGSSKGTRSRGRASADSPGTSSGSSRTRASGRQTRSKQASGASAQQAQSRSRPASSRARSTSGNARETSGGARSASSISRGQANHSTRETIANIGIPVVSATIGVAGGVLLGRTTLQRNRKLLGIPLPVKIDLADVSQQIGEAGRQFAKLATEVRTARERAEKIGRAIT